jgi:DNA-binding beta-propeller fold protein YncE
MAPDQMPEQTPAEQAQPEQAPPENTQPAEAPAAAGATPQAASGYPPVDRSADPRKMTGPERRRRIFLLALLLLILAILGYAAFYYIQNRALPTVAIAPPEANGVTPPQFLFSFAGEGANQLKRPVGIAIGPDRRVYVVDFGNKRVSVFTHTGQYLFSFEKLGDGGKLMSPVHLAVKGNEVWVTDRQLRKILIFDLEGKYLRSYETKNEKLNWSPLALTFNADGALRVTDVGNTDEHRVIYFSTDGSRTAMFGKTAQANQPNQDPGGFLFPNGIVVGKTGSVFISDGDNRRIQVFSPAGVFERFVNTSGVPRGLAFDAKQRLYVVDALAHDVQVYAADGKKMTQFGTRGFGPGQFNFPNDVAIDQQGRIYITDRENNQVQVWGWPIAALPPLPSEAKSWSWALCLLPLLLLPLLLLRRKIRIVVTLDFIEGLADAQEIAAVARKRRIRLVAPTVDRPLYEGRVVEGVVLTDLVTFEEYSDSDARSLIDRLKVTEAQAIPLSMAWRARALATEDRELRWLAVLAEVRAVDVAEFRTMYLNRDEAPKEDTL